LLILLTVRTNLAKLLVRGGLVSLEQIREAVESGKESGYDLGESLAALGYVEERQLVEFLSREYGVPSMDIDSCETDQSVIRLVPRETALEKFLVPISVEGADLTIAVSDPSNILMLDDLGFITGKNIKPVVASERSIRNKLAEYYGNSGEDEPPSVEETEEVQDVGSILSNPGPGSGADFTEAPAPEAVDRITGEDYKPGPDFVFDFTVVKGGDTDLPLSPAGERDMFEEENSGSEEDADANAVQAGSTGPESPAVESFDAGPAAEDTGSGNGPGLLTNNNLDGVDVENPDPRPAAQLNESSGKSAGEPVSSEQYSGGAVEPSGESAPRSGENGFSPSHVGPGEAAQLISGMESHGPGSKVQENRGSVLIVDVSPTVRKIMRISLERAGYKVVSASDGMQALAKLNEAIPDLIFVDIRLPHMDGYQLCKVIKSHGLTNKVPVVMISGKARVLDKMKIKMAGASDLITKPFGSADLVGAVEKYAG
jgi:CheY-like chemotaxis protein